MKYVWETNQQPRVLLVSIYSPRPQPIVISVDDSSKPNTCYSYQETTVNGKEDFEISLPLTPKKAFIEINVSGKGEMPWNQDNSIKVILKEQPYAPKWNCNFNSDPILQDFLRFASWFSENAGILSSSYNDEDGSIYASMSGRFRIKYVPVIIDDQEFFEIGNGKLVRNPGFGLPSPTSMRVHTQTLDMEAAQKYVKDYTVTQRIGLLAHEYSHPYLNKNPADEFEADKNALYICRCLGFGKRELGTAFTKVFLRYESEENAQRALAIMDLLRRMD